MRTVRRGQSLGHHCRVPYGNRPGEEQGPFPMAMMGAWFVSGHFDENVMVRPMNEQVTARRATLSMNALTWADQGFQLLSIHADAFRRAAAEVVPQMKHEFHVDDQRLDDERVTFASCLLPIWRLMLSCRQEEDTSDGQEVALWMYLDDSGEKQGPFTGTQMLAWYNAGFLDGSVRVRRKASPDETFFPIGDDAEALFTATVEEGLEETEKPSDEAAAVVREGPDTKWFYIDDLGIEQGPYPAAHMRSWYDRGFLKPGTTPCAFSACLPTVSFVCCQLYESVRATRRNTRCSATASRVHSLPPIVHLLLSL